MMFMKTKIIEFVFLLTERMFGMFFENQNLQLTPQSHGKQIISHLIRSDKISFAFIDFLSFFHCLFMSLEIVNLLNNIFQR